MGQVKKSKRVNKDKKINDYASKIVDRRAQRDEADRDYKRNQAEDVKAFEDVNVEILAPHRGARLGEKVADSILHPRDKEKKRRADWERADNAKEAKKFGEELARRRGRVVETPRKMRTAPQALRDERNEREWQPIKNKIWEEGRKNLKWWEDDKILKRVDKEWDKFEKRTGGYLTSEGREAQRRDNNRKIEEYAKKRAEEEKKRMRDSREGK